MPLITSCFDLRGSFELSTSLHLCGTVTLGDSVFQRAQDGEKGSPLKALAERALAGSTACGVPQGGPGSNFTAI